MKLSLDENISFKLERFLKDCFGEVKHVRSFNLEDVNDIEVWEFAKLKEFTMLSKDSDFNDLNVWRGFPPKIIWLRCGNQPTKIIEQIVKENIHTIKEFYEENTLGLLEIFH